MALPFYLSLRGQKAYPSAMVAPTRQPVKTSCQAVISTPIPGVAVAVWLNSPGDALSRLEFVDSRMVSASNAGVPLVRQVHEEIQAYFRNPAARFSVPLELTGTQFQRRVWEALRQIRAGRVQYYGELAAHLASSARAVGGACAANPLPLVVPCHRVVAKSGIGGFSSEISGDRIALKQWLLSHEGCRV